MPATTGAAANLCVLDDLDGKKIKNSGKITIFRQRSAGTDV